jgi:hypothetical protein
MRRAAAATRRGCPAPQLESTPRTAVNPLALELTVLLQTYCGSTKPACDELHEQVDLLMQARH